MDEMKKVYECFTAVWKFYRKYWDVKPDDEYWEAVIAESNQLYEEMKSELCKALILAVIDDMERRSKR